MQSQENKALHNVIHDAHSRQRTYAEDDAVDGTDAYESSSDDESFADISPLGALSSLEDLNLSSNKSVTDISALASLTAVTNLDISDIEELCEMLRTPLPPAILLPVPDVLTVRHLPTLTSQGTRGRHVNWRQTAATGSLL